MTDALPARARPRSIARSSLDSTYAPTIEHLHEIAAGLDDTARVRRSLALLTRFDSVSPNAEGRRWQVAAYLGDTAEMRRALASDSILDTGPWYVVFYALDNPLDLRGTEAIYPRALARGATAEERQGVEGLWNRYELIRGRPGRAPALSGAADYAALTYGVLDGLFAGADSTVARSAGGKLEAQLGRPLRAGDADQVRARYAVGQYAAGTGRPEVARRAIADLRAARADPDSAWQADGPRAYALLLETQVASTSRQPGAADLLRQLDSALADPVDTWWASYGNLIAARLHEQRAEIPAALAALHRRVVGFATFPALRDLSAGGRTTRRAYGRPSGAIRAYRHYLALRSEAEPALQPEVRRVREELEAVERESPDR